MPWEIKQQGGQHCVVKKNGGKVVHCHPTEEKAKAHLRALYANEPSSKAFQEIKDTIAERLEEMDAIKARGNFGHSGRPGRRGGSSTGFKLNANTPDSNGERIRVFAHLDSMFKDVANPNSWGSATHVRETIRKKFNLTHQAARQYHLTWAARQGSKKAFGSEQLLDSEEFVDDLATKSLDSAIAQLEVSLDIAETNAPIWEQEGNLEQATASEEHAQSFREALQLLNENKSLSDELIQQCVDGMEAIKASDAAGFWRTIRGAHVFIDADGIIKKGPKDLIGRNAKKEIAKESEAAAHKVKSPDEASKLIEEERKRREAKHKANQDAFSRRLARAAGKSSVDVMESLFDDKLEIKARGNFGHSGRPGQRGGSAKQGGSERVTAGPEGNVSVAEDLAMEAARKEHSHAITPKEQETIAKRIAEAEVQNSMMEGGGLSFADFQGVAFDIEGVADPVIAAKIDKRAYKLAKEMRASMRKKSLTLEQIDGSAVFLHRLALKTRRHAR